MLEWTPYEHDLDRITVTRFTRHEQIQHVILIVSFALLIVTGLPMLLGTGVSGAFSLRTWIHHLAGATLIVLALYHTFWILLTEEGRRDFGSVMPRVQDVRDLVQFVKYQLGKSDDPPQFDKFDPFEKFEYFAVVWGSIIMIVTGLMMWFFELTLRVFPKWVYDLVLLIHGYEAVLAFLAVILGHLYNVHLKPGVFPMSRVWLDGKMTLRKLKEHHPREYERWLAAQRIQRATDGQQAS